MKARFLTAGLAALLCIGCLKKSEPASFKVEVVDGVKTVRNFRARPGSGTGPISFQVDLSIGVEEGDEKYTFVSPADIVSDRHGDIFVLDSRDAAVKEYDPRGTFLRQFGRRGQGPGELQTPSCLRLGDEDEVCVRDENKIEVFSGQGEYLRTLPVGGYSNFDILGRDTLITEQRTSGEKDAEYSSLFRVDLRNHESRTLFKQRVYWPARIMDNEFVYEYPYFIVWDVGPQEHVYAGSGVDSAISVFDAGGGLMFRFVRDEAPVPVVGEEMKKIEAMTSRSPAGAVENPFRAKLVYPAFKSISVDEMGRVWVQRYRPLWRKRVNRETPFDVFSDDGVFLFTTAVPGHIYPRPYFRSGFLYALMKNDAGYTAAVRIRMKEGAAK